MNLHKRLVFKKIQY